MHTDNILKKAEAMGLLPVESKFSGVHYIFDQHTHRVMIITEQGERNDALILPGKAVKELAEAMEVLFG